MSNKQQTAVTYLSIQLSLLEMMRYNGGMTEIEYLKAKIKVIDEAREMEREQKKETFIQSRNTISECPNWNCVGSERKWESFEEFYEQTYGGNK